MTHSVHGSAVLYRETGLLIRGPSGSGKSLLAARLILSGGLLIGDDRLALSVEGGSLHAAPVPPLEGLIELRGRGLVAVPYAATGRIDAVVDVVAAADLERMPEEAEGFAGLLGVRLPRQAVPDRLDHALILIEALCGGFARGQGLRSPPV